MVEAYGYIIITMLISKYCAARPPSSDANNKQNPAEIQQDLP